MHMYILYMLHKHTHIYMYIIHYLYVCMYVCILVTVICRFMCMYMYMYACTCVHVTHAEKDTSSNTCLEEAHELATWDPPVLLHSETLEDCRAERGRRRERETERRPIYRASLEVFMISCEGLPACASVRIELGCV